MKRIVISLLSVSLLVAASQALTPPQPTKPADEPKLQKPQDKKKTEPADPDEEETKIFDRLTKNSKKAEERIGKPDLGEETRQVEKNILKDIEELIKRMQRPPQSSDSSQSDSSSSSNSDSSSSSGGSSSSSGQSSSQPQSGQKSGANGLSRQERREQRRQQQGKGSSGSKQEKSNGGTTMAQNSGNPKSGSGDPKPKDTGNPMKPDQNSNSQTNTGGRPPTNPKSPPSDSPPSGMYKDVWGHLPEKMRQEMDAYFKERFMPRYSDLLKEYYSTISEQGKK